MAKSKILNDLSDGDLLTELAETKEELFNLRFQLVTGQLDNPTLIKQVKKQVARVLTELRAREIEGAEALEAAGATEAADATEAAGATKAADATEAEEAAE